MKKDMIDNLTLTTKQRKNILHRGNKAIRASERRMYKKGFVMSRVVTEADRNDHIGCDGD